METEGQRVKIIPSLTNAVENVGGPQASSVVIPRTKGKSEHIPSDTCALRCVCVRVCVYSNGFHKRGFAARKSGISGS